MTKRNSCFSARMSVLLCICAMLTTGLIPIAEANRLRISSLNLSPSTLVSGGVSEGTITLSAPAPADGAIISLSSSNPEVVQVPESITVPANSTSGTFQITNSLISAPETVTISATYKVTATAELRLLPGVALDNLTLKQAGAEDGGSWQGTVTLSAPAPSGGTVVYLSSDNHSLAAVPSSVTVPEGEESIAFSVETSPDSSPAFVNISASYNGVTHISKLDAASGTASPQLQAAAATGASRGYLTTPAELTAIAQKASQGIQPYKSAVTQVVAHAGSPTSWSFGTISGNQNCSATYEPGYIGRGNTYIYAKALAYHLTGNSQYAAVVREKLLDLVDTYGYGGNTYSGSNQCILNLSWYMLDWIQAADLLEGYSGWTAADKRSFQQWLANEIFKKVEWSSDRRSNNWGTAGTATTAIIADYLTGSGLMLKDRNGALLTPRQAYDEARQRAFDRIKGNAYMDNYSCSDPDSGIRPDGGAPEELARSSQNVSRPDPDCKDLWVISQNDAAYTYQMVQLEGLEAHAELLLRRGDRSLYDYLNLNGKAAILRGIYFIIRNPNDLSKSLPWACGRLPQLELAYRYYRDSYVGQQLGIGRSTNACGSGRYVGGKASTMIHWTTLTHGFATNENPGLPPAVAPPGL